MARFEVSHNGATYQIDAPDERAAFAAFQSMIGGGSEGAPKKEAPGVVEDVAKTIVPGMARGLLSATVGLPGVAEDIGTLAYDQTLGRLANRFLPGGDGTFSARGKDFYKQRIEQNRQQASKEIGVPLPAVNTPGDYFNPANAIKAAEGVTGPFYQPQTTAGKFANTAAEFAGGALPMGPLTLKNVVTSGAVPGLASEAAGQATEGTALEPWARFGAALGAGVAGSVATGSQGGQRVLQNAMQGVDDATMNAARQLLDDATRMGVPLTWSEALNQVTGGGARRLAGVQRAVEESAGAADQMGRFMAQRPGQIQAAGNQAMVMIGPGGTPPTQTGIAVSKASESILADARKARTSAVDPYYSGAANDIVPAPVVRELMDELDKIIAADPTGKLTGAAQQIKRQLIEKHGTPEIPAQPATRTPVIDPASGRTIRYDMTPSVPGVPATPDILVTNVGQLNEIYKAARDNNTFGGMRPIGATATEVQADRLARQALQPLDETMQSFSPSYSQGKAAYGKISDKFITPMEEGQIGKLSQTTDPGRQAGILLPSKPVAGAAAETEKTIQALVKKDPKAAQDIIRSHAETLFNETIQANMGGANQFGGAKFAAFIAGNPEQRRALQAAVEALPAGQARWQGFNRFLDVMEATGKRLPANSATAEKTEIARTLSRGGLASELAQSSTGGFTKVPSILRERYQDYLAGKNSAELARIMTDPASVKLLARLAKTPVDSPVARNLAISLIQSSEKRSNQIERQR
jgi:hypothetical protein